MTEPFRILVSHSTRDTNVLVFWRFLDELQLALDKETVPIRLVNIVSECGGMIVPGLQEELESATERTDITMMVLTQGYIDSPWCDDEMHARARSACKQCPSHRLFPLAWRNYPWDELWSRKIEGWGVNLQSTITDDLLAKVESNLWETESRPKKWHEAINSTVVALDRFINEIKSTCTGRDCPAWVLPSVPVPRRLD